MTLIKADDIWALWSILIIFTALSIYLEQKTVWGGKVTGPIIGLVLAIIASNTNIIPAQSVVYDSVSTYCIPLAVSLLLLKADVRKIFSETGQAIKAFHFGALGTLVGSFLAYFVLRAILPEAAEMAAVITGSFIGGGVNLFAVADSFNVSGDLIGAYLVADNLIMALFFFLCLSIPNWKWFRDRYSHPHEMELEEIAAQSTDGESVTRQAKYWKAKEISMLDMAISLAAAFAISTLSVKISELISANTSGFLQMFLGNTFVILTTISLIVASIFPRFFEELNGTDEIGTFMIYIFFVVIGVPAKLMDVITKAPILFLFCFIVASCTLLVALGLGKLFKLNIEEITMSVNACLGGPTSAAAHAIAKGWDVLVVPGLLVGLWGYIIGTYLGITVGSFLGLG